MRRWKTAGIVAIFGLLSACSVSSEEREGVTVTVNGGNSVTVLGVGVLGNGNVITQPREASGFEKISITGSITLRASAGGAFTVTVDVDENLQAYVVSEVSDGELKLRTSEPIRPSTDIIVTVGAPTLSGVAMRGSTDATVSGLTGDSFVLNASGSASATLSGTVAAFEAVLSGSTDLNASDLITKKAEVTVSGSGSADLHATEELDARVSGSGDITYAGNPPKVETNLSGSGSVEPNN